MQLFVICFFSSWLSSESFAIFLQRKAQVLLFKAPVSVWESSGQLMDVFIGPLLWLIRTFRHNLTNWWLVACVWLALLCKFHFFGSFCRWILIREEEHPPKMYHFKETLQTQVHNPLTANEAQENPALQTQADCPRLLLVWPWSRKSHLWSCGQTIGVLSWSFTAQRAH